MTWVHRYHVIWFFVSQVVLQGLVVVSGSIFLAETPHNHIREKRKVRHIRLEEATEGARQQSGMDTELRPYQYGSAPLMDI